MKICEHCQNRVADPVMICPFCGAQVGEAPPAPPEEIPTLEMERRRQMVVMGNSERRWTFWLTPMFLLLFFGGGLLWFLRPIYFPIEAVSGEAGGHPCQGYETCVLVYVAPWCSACRQSIPVIESFQERLEESEIGFAVVIGSDSQKALEEMGKGFSAEIYYDPKHIVPELLDFKIIPAWFKLNREGKILEEASGTLFPVESQAERLGLSL